jgi:hypothetical protein
MTGRAITEEEKRAAKFVASCLGGNYVPRDIDGAPPMTHDFDIHVYDKVIALEITSASDKAMMTQTAQAFKREWPAPSLANDWQIGVNRTAGQSQVDLNPVKKKIEKVLAVFERHDVKEVGAVGLSTPPRWHGAPQDVIDATTEMFVLGVTLARMHRPAKIPGGALVLPSIHGGHGADADDLIGLAERDGKSNAEKLQNAEADERHLWIWVDGTTPDAELAMHLGHMPSGPPELPTGVDVVWAAMLGVTGLGQMGFERVLRVRPPGSWEMLDTTQVG